MRTTVLLLGLMVGVLSAQAPGPRPWMQGAVEKGCGLTDDAIAKLKEEHPNIVVEKCECRHVCDPLDPHAEETDGRKWDGRCAARCSTSNCRCPHVCDS